jgi:hypothetical protein
MLKPSSQTKKVLTILSIALLIISLPKLVFADGAGPVQTLLMNIVSGVFGMFLGWAGSLLDYAIGEFVAGFGRVYEETGLGFSIDNLWSTVRDLFNLTFIFGLVFIGFRMIFNSSDSSARRMLGLLVMAALLVNFSLFITKFVIDFSNIAATQLAAGFEDSAEPGTYKVSGKFMSILGLTTVLDTKGKLVGANGTPIPDGAIYGYIFGSLVMYLVAMFIFAAGAFLLIIRFVVLNIYMVLSPLMFLGWVFPGFSNVSKEYWSGFLSRAFFAPAYILMIYFSHQILVNMKGVLTAGSQGIGAALVEPKSSTFLATFPFFILTSTFLIASLVIANKMGAVGASNALSLGKRISGGARKYATNAALAPARKVGTMASGAAAKYGERVNNRLQMSTGGKFAKGLLSAATLGALNERGRQNLIATGKNAKFGGKYSSEDDKNFNTKTQATANKTAEEKSRRDSLNSSTKILDDNTQSAENLGQALDALAKSVQKMSSEEKVDLGFEKLTNQNIAAHLTDADITSWSKEGKFSSEKITQIRKARQDGIVATAVGGSTLAKVKMVPPPVGSPAGTQPTTSVTYDNPNITSTNANGEQTLNSQLDKRASFTPVINREAKDMPIEIFASPQMQPYITPEMIEELIKNGKLSDPNKQAEIRNNIQAYVDAATTPENMRAKWKRWGDNTTLGAGFGVTAENRTPAANTSNATNQAAATTQPSIILDSGGYNSTRPRT